MNWWPFRKRTVASAASQLARHGAEQRRDKRKAHYNARAREIAERLERPDLVERLAR